MTAILYTDGGSRGEGKRGAVGVSLCNAAGRELLAVAEFIGPATSNQAEYRALLRGLQLALELEVTRISVFSDSRLMVCQMTGKMTCSSTNLVDLHARARSLARRFHKFSITHVYREDNQRADQLANQAFADRGCRLEYTGDE